MNFFSKLKLSFLSIVFIILIPITIIISISMAILNYHQSYEHILEGLNKKILSSAAITASFINGDDHKFLAIPKQMKAFTHDNKEDILYAVDTNNNLYTIHKKLGAAIEVKDINLQQYQISDISINSQKQILYLSTQNELLSVDLNTKIITVLKQFSFDIKGLVYDLNKDSFFVSSVNSLYSFKSNKVTKLHDFETTLYSLNIVDKTLYGVDRDSNKIFSIDLKNYAMKHLELKNINIDSSKIYHLAMDESSFYSGDQHLMIYDRKTEKLEHEDFARLYRDESSEKYKKHIEPMTEIKLALDLTYHYTFNLLYGDDENNCYYIFDVHEGNEYNPIGSYDSMDHDDLIGAEEVMLRDKPYVGDIKLWEKWGLLKVAYAGIKDSEGKLVAVTGADIDISIIKAKTHDALIYSITIGIFTLIISIFASYFIARKIVGPINTLKRSALKIAAGQYEEKIHIKSPIELATLSRGFNHMSDQLTMELSNFKTYSMEIRDRNIYKKLQKKLYSLTNIEDLNIGIHKIDDISKPYGAIYYNDSYYVWSNNEIIDDELEVTQQSALMTNLLTHIIKADESIDTFSDMFPLELFVVIDTHHHTITNVLEKSEKSYDTSIMNTITIGNFNLEIPKSS